MIKLFHSNQYLVVALRIIVGLTFLFASIDKISRPAEFAMAIANYKLIAGPTTLIVATVLPWIELLCGLAVLSGVFLRGATLLLFTILSVFTLAVITGLIRGLDISCGCFTLDPDVDRIGFLKVIENLGLILGAVIVFYSEATRFVLKTNSAD